MDVLLTVKEKYNFPYEFKPAQVAIMKNVIEKQHTCGILPTGFGKSDCFAVPQLALDEIYPETKPHIGIVVSPLRSLMINQKERWSKLGITTGCILKLNEMTSQEVKDIIEGKCSLVLTSPEAICKESWRSMLTNSFYKERLAFLACDEAHCIVEWGEDFRPEYKQVTVLRSLLSCPVMILTATATENLRKRIISNLLLDDKDVKTVAVIPDRPNIFLHYKSEPAMSFSEELAWYLQHIREEKQNAKKAIIYCRTIKEVADIFEYFVYELGHAAWCIQGKTVENRLIDMYHSSLDADTEKRIVSVFPSENSVIRCLISTVAFGMGIQVNDIDIVLHWGISKSILAYWQEVGRCGRDGRQAEAFLYATKRSLDKRRVSEEVINFCHGIQSDSGSCIRYQILQHLIVSGMEKQRLHELQGRAECRGSVDDDICTCQFYSCCSNCRKKCKNNKLSA